jgi:hypothetical protein
VTTNETTTPAIRLPAGRRPDGRIRSAWRWLADQIATYHWWILAVAGIAAFVFGFWGWWEYKATAHPTAGDIAFAFYWSLKGFLANSPNDRVIPWQLNVSRFLAPLVAGWAGYSALASLFRDRI